MEQISPNDSLAGDAFSCCGAVLHPLSLAAAQPVQGGRRVTSRKCSSCWELTQCHRFNEAASVGEWRKKWQGIEGVEGLEGLLSPFLFIFFQEVNNYFGVLIVIDSLVDKRCLSSRP